MNPHGFILFQLSRFGKRTWIRERCQCFAEYTFAPGTNIWLFFGIKYCVVVANKRICCYLQIHQAVLDLIDFDLTKHWDNRFRFNNYIYFSSLKF